MKITLKTKPLLALVQALVKVIPARSAQPILENFLVSATSGGVSITSEMGTIEAPAFEGDTKLNTYTLKDSVQK